MKHGWPISPVIILILILSYPLLFIWQGLDFTDVGFHLTNCQQIFDDSTSVSYAFVNWLTYVIGGFWLSLFGDSLGLLGVRIFGVLVLYIITFLCYLTLKPYMDQQELLIGLLISVLLASCFGGIPSYNKLTSLFFVLSAFFLIKGLVHSKSFWIMLAGSCVGLNIFIRFPNIMGVTLILGIFLNGYMNKSMIRTQIRQSLSFVLGCVIAVLIAIVAMKLLGHYELYIDSVKYIFRLGASASSSHNTKSLLNLFIKDHMKTFRLLFVGLTVLFISSKFLSYLKNIYLNHILIIVLSVAVSLVIIRTGRYRGAIITVLGIQYLVLLGYIFNAKGVDSNFRLISFITLLLLIITPLGSGNGIRNAVHAMHLSLPITYFCFSSLRKTSASFRNVSVSSESQYSISLDERETNYTRKLFAISLIVFLLLLAYRHTYRDSLDRFEMIHSVKHSSLKGIYTTKERARSVQELLDAANIYVKADDYLLACESIPMFHFLTKTKPYLYNAWPMLYMPATFTQKLEKAVTEKTKLPIAVRAKVNMRSFQWPKDKMEPTLSERDNANRKTINDFILENEYSTVWQNDAFEIMIAPTQDKK